VGAPREPVNAGVPEEQRTGRADPGRWGAIGWGDWVDNECQLLYLKRNNTVSKAFVFEAARAAAPVSGGGAATGHLKRKGGRPW